MGDHPGFPAQSIIGQPLPRANARSLVAGRGRYTDDIALPRMVHVAFLRSPFAHARVRSVDTSAAARLPGVVRVFTGADLLAVCKPLHTELAHMPQHVSAVQSLLAIDEIAWQGEAVAAVAAATRAEAEDALAAIAVEWEELPAVADAAAALMSDAPPVHRTLQRNLALSIQLGGGDVDGAFRNAAYVAAHEFDFGRVTAVALEPRVIIADYNPADHALTVYQGHQSPHMMQEIYARHLGLAAHKVRVVARDVGGAFGSKLHVYADEMAVAAMAVVLARPVKFVSDRLEAFQTDVHARECRVSGRVAVAADGRLLAMDAQLLSGCGAYSVYPRSSIGDGLQAASMIGAAYDLPALRASLQVAYQNKAPTGALRGVGQPLSCAVTEQLLEDAAAAVGLDPVEMRRRNYPRPEQFPRATPGGLKLTSLSLHACLDRLVARMDYAGRRAEQAELRARGIHRGIGVATFLEQTAVGPALYGPAELPATAQDTCLLRMEPSGVLRCEVGCTDQGQGTLAGIAQIVASAMGLPIEDVAVSAGDSAGAPGGGAWASRGLAIGGEAALAAARALRRNLLAFAAVVLQTTAEALDIRDGAVVTAADGARRLGLGELGRLAYYRQDQFPPGTVPELTVVRQFTPQSHPYFMANGVQASLVEVDVETGWITLLGHWAVEDCGHIVNPLLVDEQLRGGIVQGLGAALYEHCVYGAEAQLMSGTLADYLVPMAADMPDIVIDHVTTPQPGTELGLKGVGEAGTVGASAAVWCAVNDALRPLGARVTRQPFTPAVVLEAVAAARQG